jgi:hypothetical protein
MNTTINTTALATTKFRLAKKLHFNPLEMFINMGINRYISTISTKSDID